MKKSCCFIGHRTITETPALCDKIKSTVIRLIQEEDVGFFFFGSKSQFNDLCLKIVSEIKTAYPDIKLVYVRSKERFINQTKKDALLKIYDDTLMPSDIENAGKASYVERNQRMIDASDFCVFYFDSRYEPPLKTQFASPSLQFSKSGTMVAYQYALQRKKNIINLHLNELTLSQEKSNLFS